MNWASRRETEVLAEGGVWATLRLMFVTGYEIAVNLIGQGTLTLLTVHAVVGIEVERAHRYINGVHSRSDLGSARHLPEDTAFPRTRKLKR